MSVELMTPVDLPEPWEVEEPRRRRFSPVEEEHLGQAGLRRGRGGWTSEQYLTMPELGVLGPEEKLELIDGEILAMSPQKSLHTTGIERVADAIRGRFDEPHCIRRQSPLECSPIDLPEPDVAVVSGDRDDYEDQHPTSALLVVEVSDTTLRFDRGDKANLYASSGVADYWVCDLRRIRLIVHRNPIADPEAHRGHRYASVETYELDEEVTPLAGNKQAVRVREMFPKKLGAKKK